MADTAFLFPGQGAQVVGMAGTLCDRVPAAKSLFDRAADILDYDLLTLCRTGPAERLNATDISQPAIFVASLAALTDLQQAEPDTFDTVKATAGLSLGEYTALVFAGAMNFEDGLKIVQARGRAMQAASEATPSGMASVIGLELDEVEMLIAEARGLETLEVANLLCPGNTVVSGSAAAMSELARIAETRNLRVIPLAVAGAFHTKLMKPADDQLADALARIVISTPRIPVWSNVDAQPHTDPREIRDLLVRQVVQPVLWESTMRNLLASGVGKFYEIGPGRVLAGLLKRVDRKIPIVNIAAT